MPSRFWKASGNALLPGKGFFAPAAAGGSSFRAFRLRTTNASSNSTVGVAEFGPATTAGGANVAIGAATATATTTNGSFVPANTIDGDNTTLWNSSTFTPTSGTPQDLVLDFGATTGNWKTPVEFILTAWASNGALMTSDGTIDATTGDPSASPTWTTLKTLTGLSFTNGETKRIAYP